MVELEEIMSTHPKEDSRSKTVIVHAYTKKDGTNVHGYKRRPPE